MSICEYTKYGIVEVTLKVTQRLQAYCEYLLNTKERN